MGENEFLDLLSLKLSGEATTEQLRQLDRILETNSEYKFLHDQMLIPPKTIAEEQISQSYLAHVAKMQIAGKLDYIQDSQTPILPIAEKITRTNFTKK